MKTFLVFKPRRYQAALFKQLKMNMAFAVLGQAVYVLSQYLLIVLLTHLGGVEQVGLLILGFSVSAPIMMLCNFRLNLLLASDMRSTFKFLDYFTLRLFTTLLGFLVIIFVALLFLRHAFLIIVLIGLTKCFEALSDICFAFAQKIERNKHIGMSQMFKNMLALPAFFLIYKLTLSLPLAFFVFGIAKLAGLVFYDLPVVAKFINPSRVGGPFTVSFLKTRVYQFIAQSKTLLIAGLPLSLVAGLNSLNTNIPRYFVEKLLDDRMLGHFSPINYIFNMSLVMVGMMLAATLPRLSKYYYSYDKKSLTRMIRLLLILVVCMGGLAVLTAYFWGGQIITFFFGKIYAESAGLLFIYLIAATVNYIGLIFIYLLTAMRKLQVQIFVFLLTSMVTASSCWYLVPRYQLAGAVWAEVIAGVFFAASTHLLSVFFRRHSQWNGTPGMYLPDGTLETNRDQKQLL